MKYIYFRWKQDFKDIPWYQENPADSYLSSRHKYEMLRAYVLDQNDLDSEAELVIVDDFSGEF